MHIDLECSLFVYQYKNVYVYISSWTSRIIWIYLYPSIFHIHHFSINTKNHNMLLESLWYHGYYKFNGPVVLPFVSTSNIFWRGDEKHDQTYDFLNYNGKRSPPSLDASIWQSEDDSSVGRESKQDATFAWGFMPPYCHRDDQTWWYVGWLVVFWSGFNYWHCLFWPLTAVSWCRNFGRLVGFGSNRKATQTQFQWPEWLLQCFIMRRQSDQSHQMMQWRMIDCQIKGLKLIVIIRLFQNPKLYLCCNPESNLYNESNYLARNSPSPGCPLKVLYSPGVSSAGMAPAIPPWVVGLRLVSGL